MPNFAIQAEVRPTKPLRSLLEAWHHQLLQLCDDTIFFPCPKLSRLFAPRQTTSLSGRISELEKPSRDAYERPITPRSICTEIARTKLAIIRRRVP